MEESTELYTCSPSSHSSEIPADWDTDGSGIAKGNITIHEAYNELATLMSVPGEDAIRHLFRWGGGLGCQAGQEGLREKGHQQARPAACCPHPTLPLPLLPGLCCLSLPPHPHLPPPAHCSRGTHREFGYAALLTMLVFYFLGAAYTAGSAISSGTFVPMLLIGACIGRLVVSVVGSPLLFSACLPACRGQVSLVGQCAGWAEGAAPGPAAGWRGSSNTSAEGMAMGAPADGCSCFLFCPCPTNPPPPPLLRSHPTPTKPPSPSNALLWCLSGIGHCGHRRPARCRV